MVRTFVIVKGEPISNFSFGLCDSFVGFEIYLFILQAAPQALAEDVVETAAFAVHADADALVR